MTEDIPDLSSPSFEEMHNWLLHYGVKGMKWGVRKETVMAYKPLVAGSITPVAILAGLGPPASVALGLGIYAVQQHPLSTAIAKGASVSSDIVKTAGNKSVEAMQQAVALLPGITIASPSGGNEK